MIYHKDDSLTIIQGDARNMAEIPDKSVHCIVTSPPYFGLRDYQIAGQIGLEPSLQEYIDAMCAVADECWRVLRDDGVMWFNIGDSYNGSGGAGGDYGVGGIKEGQPKYPGRSIDGLKPKDLIGVPWRLAFAFQDRCWYLRSEIIWAKPNPMPESVTDRPTKSHEYIFLLTKSARYFYDHYAVMEEAAFDGRKDTVMKGSAKYENGFVPNQSEQTVHARGHERWPNKTEDGLHGRNRRDVWTITTKGYAGAHFAVFPPELPEICIKAGTSEKGVCPHCGAQWERVVDREANNHISRPDRQAATGGAISGGVGKNFPDINLTTSGFRPTCNCPEHKPAPAVVLDPFGGSGTTGRVALSLSRHAILNELNPEYIELQMERTASNLPLFAKGQEHAT